jgi:hypothetical protein
MSEQIVVLFWLMVGIIAVTAIIFRYLGERGRNALLRALVEKDQPLPPGLLRETPQTWDPRGFVVAGILLIGLGAATALFGLALASGLMWADCTNCGDDDAPARMVLFLSLFPFCLGAACLVIGRYLKSNG